MTLENTLLEKLSEWQPSGAGRQTLTVADDASGWVVSLAADRNDQIATAVWELNLRRTRPAAEGVTLKGWADLSAKRIKGLLEPLAVIEIDAPRSEALLRSGDPTRRGDAVAYYEIRLQGTTGATVQRFTAGVAGSKREQVAFALTHEVLAHLVVDLTGA